jgi:hypothetical protein
MFPQQLADFLGLVFRNVSESEYLF